MREEARLRAIADNARHRMKVEQWQEEAGRPIREEGPMGCGYVVQSAFKRYARASDIQGDFIVCVNAFAIRENAVDDNVQAHQPVFIVMHKSGLEGHCEHLEVVHAELLGDVHAVQNFVTPAYNPRTRGHVTAWLECGGVIVTFKDGSKKMLKAETGLKLHVFEKQKPFALLTEEELQQDELVRLNKVEID